MRRWRAAEDPSRPGVWLILGDGNARVAECHEAMVPIDGQLVPVVSPDGTAEQRAQKLALFPELLDLVARHGWSEHKADEHGFCPCRQCVFIRDVQALLGKVGRHG